MVYQICYQYMKSKAETDDMVQEVFIKILYKNPSFESSEHEKAWIIVVAANTCKNQLKNWFRKVINIDNIVEEELISHNYKSLIDDVRQLPFKYRIIVYLYYYMGYSSKEIAKILNKKESTIRSLLLRARNKLKKEMEDYDK